GRAPLPLPRRVVRHRERPPRRRAAAPPLAEGHARGPGRGRLCHGRRGADGMRAQFTREQRTTGGYGILSLELIRVVLQLLLLMATMNAFLGGDAAVVWPAALASLACLGLNLGLLRYLYGIER